jgi:uridine phosphorylase
MRKIFFATVAMALLFSSPPAMAAYLDFSTNWDAPSTKPMSKRAATNVVMQCKTVAAYSNMAGARSGAMVVAGPHETATDKKTHLTVRLYKDNAHAKSCHVYTGKNLDYSSCGCEYVD